MSTNLHPIRAAYLTPFAPPNSVVHTVADEAEAIKADLAYQALKDSGGLHAIEQRRALLLQIQHESK